MSFNSDIRQFTTPAAFAAYLTTLPKPAWRPKGSTYHNTYRPTEAQWRGKASMLSMQAGYKAKGWTAGPHVFLALGSPNPAHNGIWQMTMPTEPGVHGVTCNSTHFGIEVVGDFQDKPPSAAQQQLLLDVVAALHRWAGIGPVLNAHRDCVVRTCPGDAFYALKPSLSARLIMLMVASPPAAPFAAWGDIDKPTGIAQGFGVPQTWLKHQKTLGACLRGEWYELSGQVSRALFQGGEIRWFAPTNTIEVLPYPQKLPAPEEP